jgi:hypothetical protein
MIRMTVQALGLMLLLLMPTAHAIGYEMEGLLDRDDVDRRSTTTQIATRPPNLPDTATAAMELTDTWNCNKPESVVELREVQLCWVAGEAELSTHPLQAVVTDTLIRYRILIERGLELQADRFTSRVAEILNSPAGWGRNKLRFVRVSNDYKFTLLLATPPSVDRLCRPLRTGGWLSCAIHGRAIINADRWQGGAETWGDDISGYHSYLINHEVGHVLGMHHINCPTPGAPAPIMLPQTRLLQGCTANGATTTLDLMRFQRLMPGLMRRLAGSGSLKTYQGKRRRVHRSRRYRRARYRRASHRRASHRRANYKRSGYRRSGYRRTRRQR